MTWFLFPSLSFVICIEQWSVRSFVSWLASWLAVLPACLLACSIPRQQRCTFLLYIWCLYFLFSHITVHSRLHSYCISSQLDCTFPFISKAIIIHHYIANTSFRLYVMSLIHFYQILNKVEWLHMVLGRDLHMRFAIIFDIIRYTDKSCSCELYEL